MRRIRHPTYTGMFPFRLMIDSEKGKRISYRHFVFRNFHINANADLTMANVQQSSANIYFIIIKKWNKKIKRNFSMRSRLQRVWLPVVCVWVEFDPFFFSRVSRLLLLILFAQRQTSRYSMLCLMSITFVGSVYVYSYYYERYFCKCAYILVTCHSFPGHFPGHLRVCSTFPSLPLFLFAIRSTPLLSLVFWWVSAVFVLVCQSVSQSGRQGTQPELCTFCLILFIRSLSWSCPV